MTWDDLTPEERLRYYEWFLNEQCGICNRRGCAVIRQQWERAPGRDDNPHYRPEAIYGNPNNAVWYLAANPCVGGPHDYGCPVREEDCTPQDYLNHYLQWYEVDDAQRHVGDSITKASLVLSLETRGLHLDNNRINPNGHDLTRHRADLAHLCVLNIAHCKSPKWREIPDSDKRIAWDACGKKTLAMLSHWQPRAIVAFGWAPLLWLHHVHASDAPGYAEWHMDERSRDMVGRPRLPVGEVAYLQRALDGKQDTLRFVTSQRLGRHFTRERVAVVVAALHRLGV